MHLPEFNHQQKGWDKYREFHVEHKSGWENVFIQFESGEVICVNRCERDPDKRRHYREFNLQIVGTNDDKCPRLMTPDGEELKKAWLNQDGQQILLVDLCSGRATCLKGYTYYGQSRRDNIPDWVRRIPVRFRGKCCAYIPGDQEHAISAEIEVSKPRKWTEEERTRIESFRAAIKAERSLLTDGKPEQMEIKSFNLPEHFRCSMSMQDAMRQSLDEWSANKKQQLLTFGVEPPRIETKYPYLLIDNRSPILETR